MSGNLRLVFLPSWSVVATHPKQRYTALACSLHDLDSRVPMFAIQIHSVEPSPDEADEPAVINFNNVFLDISSEGQRPRYAWLACCKISYTAAQGDAVATLLYQFFCPPQ
jgi:hypothetical protein